MKNFTTVLIAIGIIFAVIVIVLATLLSWREFHRMLHRYDDAVRTKRTPHIAVGRYEPVMRVEVAGDVNHRRNLAIPSVIPAATHENIKATAKSKSAGSPMRSRSMIS